MVQGLKMLASCVINVTPPDGTLNITVIASQVGRSFVFMQTKAVSWAGPDLHVFLGKLN